MTDPKRRQLLAGEGFVEDMQRLRDAAAREHEQFPNSGQPADNVHRTRYRETLREIQRLEDGTSNGHHVLGQAIGFGDGRDVAASKISSGPGKPTDRLTFREIPARNAGGQLNARELLAVGPRHGPGNAYETTALRLGRDPNERLAALDRFGQVQISTGGKAHQRNAALDAQRAIALAYDGQKPLASSRPLSSADFGSGTRSSGQSAERPQDRDR